MKIDEYGDNIQATALRGDHWWTRHDAMLHLLHSLCQCQWSGLKATVEVFAGEVRHEGLNRSQGTGALQALVPDMANSRANPRALRGVGKKWSFTFREGPVPGSRRGTSPWQ